MTSTANLYRVAFKGRTTEQNFLYKLQNFLFNSTFEHNQTWLTSLISAVREEFVLDQAEVDFLNKTDLPQNERLIKLFAVVERINIL